MTDDLTDRLRDWAAVQRATGHEGAARTLIEAADEIDRLRRWKAEAMPGRRESTVASLSTRAFGAPLRSIRRLIAAEEARQQMLIVCPPDLVEAADAEAAAVARLDVIVGRGRPADDPIVRAYQAVTQRIAMTGHPYRLTCGRCGDPICDDPHTDPDTGRDIHEACCTDCEEGVG